MKCSISLVLCFVFVLLTNSFRTSAIRTSDTADDGSSVITTNRKQLHLQRLRDELHLPKWVFSESFILTDNLEDGEWERRISFDGITAKETSVMHSDGKGLSLLQITNGHGFLQLIYSDINELIDCDHVRQKHAVKHFLEKFYQEIDVARSRNFTSPPYSLRQKSLISNHEFRRYVEDNIIPDEYYDLNEMTPAEDAFGMRNLTYETPLRTLQDIPADMRRWLNYNELKMQCSERHRQMKQLALKTNSPDESVRRNATEYFSRKKRALSDWLIAPNTKWCGRGHNASKYSHLGGASRADKCCRKHDHCRLHIPGLTTKWGLFNYRPFTLSHCKCDVRQRRDLSSLLRVPGTKWCGKGWSAKKYADLGGFSKTDRCCRQHDKSCPFWIMAFETKYGLFNWRINTLMHCKCDERFRTCLKMADSPDANMVGKLFFNIVQTKCFVLKPSKVCKRVSYWGRCEEKVLTKRAHIRNNRRF